MIKERAFELADALESGKYTQGTQFLKTVRKGEIRHCCLGVACELAGVEWKYVGQTIFQAQSPSLMHATTLILTPEAIKYFGFNTDNGHRKDGMPMGFGNKAYGSLTSANDNGATFQEIAKAIRENWEFL